MRFSSPILARATPDAARLRVRCFAKRRLRQFLPIHAAIAIQNLPPKVPHYFVIDRLARLHQRMRDPVRLHQARAQRDEHLSHHRFAGRNAAREPNFQHAVSAQ